MTTQTGTEDTIRESNNVQGTSEHNSEVERAQSLNLTPAADICETKEGATLYVDLPGVNHDSLDISVDNDVLTVKGGVNLNTPHNLNPTYMDVHAGAFNRQFTLSPELDSSKIDATLKDGVLKLVIPRSEKHKPRKIEVKAA
jgi:HSP20 family molecular chaperone IbpA